MKELIVKSYAKINLSLDILGILENGFHEVTTIMQQISIYDLIKVKFEENSSFSIKIKTNKDFLPIDSRNLCYKAAELMHNKFNIKGNVYIDIEKNIPIAAGLAGGSSNAAAVIVALDKLWELNLSLAELMDIGKEIGSDVPFLIYTNVTHKYTALGVNRGESIIPINSKFSSNIVLIKPSFGVSTKEVYMGMDEIKEYVHPDTNKLISYIEKGDKEKIYMNMVNVLENYTLNKYIEVKNVKERVKVLNGMRFVMMSGSGPTIVGFFDEPSEIMSSIEEFKNEGYEVYYGSTMKTK